MILLAIKAYNTKNSIVSKSVINFRGGKEPSRETMHYLNNLLPFERNLSSIDLSKIQDVFEGIKLFDGIKVNDLFKDKNFFGIESILLQRGCMHQCVHCGAESPKRIQTMPWDNFTQIIDGISALSKRLGFNPFTLGKYYADSDPMVYTSKGQDGLIHNVFDAAKYMYEKIGRKTGIQTAGFLSEHSQKAAKQFVKDPSALLFFGISLHPFHKYMERSIQADMKGATEESQKWRNLYTDMMARTIKTTFGLKYKVDDYAILLEYVDSSKKLPDERKHKYYNTEAVLKLLDEILKKANIKAESLNILKRKIYLFGRNPEDAPDIQKYKIEPFPYHPYNTTMINTDGTILSNPYEKDSVFFRPKPVLNSEGKPLKLNFCSRKKISNIQQTVDYNEPQK